MSLFYIHICIFTITILLLTHCCQNLIMICSQYLFIYSLYGNKITDDYHYFNHLGISVDLDEKLFMTLRLDEKYTCPDCLDTFDDRPSLVHHRSLVCGLGLMYECVKCHRRFKHNHNLKSHGATCSRDKINTQKKSTWYKRFLILRLYLNKIII